jgi:hypothetical protein
LEEYVPAVAEPDSIAKMAALGAQLNEVHVLDGVDAEFLLDFVRNGVDT